MTTLREFISRFVSLFRKQHLEREMDDEMRAHLEMAVAEYLDRGMPPEEARYAALRELGGVEQTQELYRDQRGLHMFETFFQDLRYGLRMLLKDPGFTAIAVLTLALGIGANTAIFSVVNTVLLRGLPYKNPDRLVWITQFIPAQGNTLVFDSDYFAWSRQNRVFEGMAAYGIAGFTLTGGGDPERLEAGKVTAGFFPLLGIEPMLGRSFLNEEDRPAGPQVCVLSHALWERRFNSDRSIVGQSITLDSKPYTVLGIMPARFEFLSSRKPALYVPFDLRETTGVAPGEMHMFPSVVARLKPGATLKEAQADLAVINQNLQPLYKGGYAKMMAGARAQVMSLHDRLVGNVRPALLILQGAVGFVLLIACANVANLQLARALSRQKEIAIRTALGAGRWRLARQLLSESVLLASLGGAAGVVLAAFGVSVLCTMGPSSIPHLSDVRTDYRVLLFTALVSILTGLLFGLVPFSAAARTDPNDGLKEGGSHLSSGPGGQRLRGALMILELALALVLLTGSGLLIRSFVRLTEVDPGFDPNHVLTARVGLPLDQYSKPGEQSAFFHSLLERVRDLPGVTSADAVVSLPLQGFMMAAGFDIEGRPPRPEVNMAAEINISSPGYFHTIGVPVILGRTFVPQDTADSPRVALLNQTCARKYFPDENPLGKRIQIAGAGSWTTIIGVVGDIRQTGLVALPEPEIILPYLQSPYSGMVMVIRTTKDPLSLVPAVRSQVGAIDKNAPLFEVSTLEETLAAEFAARRFNMLLLGVFAGVALLLAVMGIYGVMSYSTAQRTHEFAIRIALGAGSAEVLRLTLRRSLVLTLAGLAIGLAGAFALTRFMSSLLYGVQPTDVSTFIAASVALAMAAFTASYIPARWATKVDPMVALRYE
jgi:putative ABC transport system permease protein